MTRLAVAVILAALAVAVAVLLLAAVLNMPDLDEQIPLGRAVELAAPQTVVAPEPPPIA